MRPTIVIDNWAIFGNGSFRRLSFWERHRWRRGKLKTLSMKSAKQEFVE